MGTFSGKRERPKYSLIVVNFQSAAALARLIQSLPEEFLSDAEVLVMNNDSEEQDLLERMFLRTSEVRVVEMEKNVGFGMACNQGALLAQGKVLLFLNPDTRFVSGSLESWLTSGMSREKILLSPALVTQNGQEEPWSYGGKVHPGSIFGQNIFPFPIWWAHQASKKMGWVSGAAFAVRREDFQSLGGFDERFFLYYEDVDLCRRALAQGFVIKKQPEVVFWHQGGSSHEHRRAQKKAYFHSQDLYIEKYYGKQWERLLRVLRRFRFFDILVWR